jgi:nicotinate-nucleotide pyrophosphorylase (carboxylating)
MEVENLINSLLELAFAEDIGDGDHTTLCSIPASEVGSSKLLIKEEGILAGVDVAKDVFHKFDPELKVEVFIEDGAQVKPGDVAFVVTGKVQSLLQTERLVLNLMQRMSGIACSFVSSHFQCLNQFKTCVFRKNNLIDVTFLSCSVWVRKQFFILI